MGIIHKKTRDGTKVKTTFGEMLAKNLASTSKQLVWFYSINGVLWIWCSYILAFMDKIQIAETLSGNVCTVVIGQIGFYLVTKTVENVFKYNDFVFKRKKDDKTEPAPEQQIDMPETIGVEYITEQEESFNEQFDIPIPKPVWIPDDAGTIEEDDTEPVG